MLKNAFYFMLKAVFALEIFNFSSRLFLLYAEKQLDKKAKVNFKIKTSQTGHQIITIRILSNISRSKGNQSVKFGQLIEHNMRKILFEKSCTNCNGETSPRPFCKQSELSISLGLQFWNVREFVFIAYPSGRLPKDIKTKILTTCFYLK